MAKLLATEASTVIDDWDSLISGAMCAPLNNLTQVFLTRAVSRQIAWELGERLSGLALAHKSAGSGLGIVRGVGADAR